MPRIALDFWIPAYIRRVELGGGYPSVIEKGSSGEGEVIIIVRNNSNEAVVYQPVNGAHLTDRSVRMWQVSTNLKNFEEFKKFEQIIKRMKHRDPDLWVIEVLDTHLRHFLSDSEIL